MKDECLRCPRASSVVSSPLGTLNYSCGWWSPQTSHEPPCRVVWAPVMSSLVLTLKEGTGLRESRKTSLKEPKLLFCDTSIYLILIFIVVFSVVFLVLYFVLVCCEGVRWVSISFVTFRIKSTQFEFLHFCLVSGYVNEYNTKEKNLKKKLVWKVWKQKLTNFKS